MLHGWMQVVGTTDVAVRALSGVLSLASLPLVWLIGRRIGGVPLAWIATGALAMSPFALRYATENRMYSLVGLLVLAGWLLVDDLWRRTSAWRVVVPGAGVWGPAADPLLVAVPARGTRPGGGGAMAAHIGG